MAEKAAAQKRHAALPDTTIAMIRTLMPSLPALLPPDISTEQFRAALWLELSGRPALKDCTLQSIRESTIKAATYGMLPGRDCHFLPFNDRQKGGKVATYVPNYFGVLLALDRTGRVDDAFAHPVYEGDVFVCDHLAGLYSHVPAYTLDPPRAQGKVRFYYACLLLKGSNKKHVETMTMEKLDAVRLRAPSHDNGPWVTDKDEMCRKTVLKRAAKYIKGAPQLHAMLADDDVRERTDIPEARHQDNLAALYGMDAGTPTDPERLRASRQTGEIEGDQMPFDLEASEALDREMAEKEK